MSYLESGQGDPIVFLHGNPTSSYLWRNILPQVSDLGRCLAPDLLGMGDSGPAPGGAYRFADHARYLDEWFAALGLDKNVVLVIHDWGSALGFYRAHRFPDSIRGIAYMEALVKPRTWEEFGEFAPVFQALRSDQGEAMVLDGNFFIEQVLPRGILRQLSEEEMNAYRRPFQTRDSRMPTLVFPRELPLNGEPKDVAELTDAYSKSLAASDYPKLLISADPGVILNGPSLEFARTFKNQTETRIRGLHYVQEDAPNEIGAALHEFLQRI